MGVVAIAVMGDLVVVVLAVLLWRRVGDRIRPLVARRTSEPDADRGSDEVIRLLR